MVSIKKILYALDMANDFLVNILKYLLGAVLGIQIIIIFMTAFMRYVVNRPLAWADEATTYMLVLVTFLGGYVAANQGALAKVELISSKFTGVASKIVQVIARLLSGGLVGWIAIFGTKLFFSPVVQNQTSSALRMPVKYVWWSLPLTMWLLFLTEVLGLIHIFVPKNEKSAVACIDREGEI